MGSEVLGWPGSNVLGSEALTRKALATEALVIDHVGHSDSGSGEGTHGAIQRLESACPISASRVNNHSVRRSMAKQSALQWIWSGIEHRSDRGSERGSE